MDLRKTTRTLLEKAGVIRTIQLFDWPPQLSVVGVTDLLKSSRLYSKAKRQRPNEGFKCLLVNGKTELRLGKNVRIINKGVLWFGISLKGTYSCPSQTSTLEMQENATLIVNGKASISSGAYCSILKNATLEIGDNVIIGSFSNIICSKNIKIGDNTLIGWNVEILDSDMHRILREGYELTKPVSIGNNVWVGSRVVICKGVTIGSGSVIATGAVVTENVPDNCLVAGVPALVKRENIKWAIS